MPEFEWPLDSAFRMELTGKWDSQFGDRRQEIVFIGQDLDQTAADAALDACLPSDEEMALGLAGWRQLQDPFPAG